MSATAPQASQKSVPKVLRIGMAQEGKIVQEKLLKIGEIVAIGDNSRNTFLISGTKLPPRFELFIPKGDVYQLQVPEWVEGKISWKDGIKGLDEIRAKGDAVKKGDLWVYTLNDTVRGKVTVGGATLLFQFVPAPPEPVRAVSAADFRPRLLDEDDPLFHGLLGVFSLVAAAFMTWVYTTPVRERVDLDSLEDAVAIVVEKKPDEVILKDPNEVLVADTTPDKKPEKKPEEKAETTQTAQKDTAPSKESVAKKSLLIQMIGSTGNTGGDAVADLLGDETASMAGLDRALMGVSGVQEATAGTLGAKSGSADGRADAAVGVGVATGGDGKVGTTAAKVTVRAKVETGTADADVESGDAGNIASVVRKSQGRIQTCLEQSLKANPSVNGRVSVGWSITAGKVTEARLVKNSTGDDALGQCVVKAVRMFRFDESLTAEVAEFPWVVSGQ